MKKIDIFTHITPPKFLKAFDRMVSFERSKDIPCRWLPGLTDLDIRFRITDEFDGLSQVLSLANPPVEAVVDSKKALELSMIANDELAELVQKYPNRFAGAVACIPMNNIDFAIRETERALGTLGLKGIQLYTSITTESGSKDLDDPIFYPIYETVVKYDLPIWIHPSKEKVKAVSENSDHPEKKDFAKAFLGSCFGLPSETVQAVTRIVFSPILSTYPGIKFILHHLGAWIPYMGNRIEMQADMIQNRDKVNYPMEKPILDYFKSFFVDTAIHGNTCALMTGLDFYGSDRVLFGTDGPFDSEYGKPTIKRTIDGIENMDITLQARRQIYYENACRLLKL